MIRGGSEDCPGSGSSTDRVISRTTERGTDWQGGEGGEGLGDTSSHSSFHVSTCTRTNAIDSIAVRIATEGSR